MPSPIFPLMVVAVALVAVGGAIAQPRNVLDEAPDKSAAATTCDGKVNDLGQRFEGRAVRAFKAPKSISRSPLVSDLGRAVMAKANVAVDAGAGKVNPLQRRFETGRSLRALPAKSAIR